MNNQESLHISKYRLVWSLGVALLENSWVARNNGKSHGTQNRNSDYVRFCRLVVGVVVGSWVVILLIIRGAIVPLKQVMMIFLLPITPLREQTLGLQVGLWASGV